MIRFKQKEFTEYDAMRSLYVELMRPENRLRIEVISREDMIPVLKGNSVIIEKFTITTSFFNKDKFRLYLKVGSKAKLPDRVRLTSRPENKKIGSFHFKFNASSKKPEEKTFGTKGKKKKGPSPFLSVEAPASVDLGYQVNHQLGEVVNYDKASRSLVLEFNSIVDAIRSLNVLPFGINYKLYLLND